MSVVRFVDHLRCKQMDIQRQAVSTGTASTHASRSVHDSHPCALPYMRHHSTYPRMPARISDAVLSPAHFGPVANPTDIKKSPPPMSRRTPRVGKKVVVTNPILGENGELSEQERGKEKEERRKEEGDETRQNRTET